MHCISLYLEKLIQSRSDTSLLHMLANYEHVVFRSMVTLSIGAFVSTVNMNLCQHHGGLT